MKDGIFDNNQQRIENEAKEKLKRMDKQEILRIAEKEKKTIKILGIISGSITIILAAICTYSYVKSYSSDPAIDSTMIFAIAFLYIIGIALYISTIIFIKKPIGKIALFAIEKETRKEYVNVIKKEYYEKIKEKQQKDIPYNDFYLSKTIILYTMSWKDIKMLIDEENNKFIIQRGKEYSRVYSFSDVINYEIYENGNRYIFESFKINIIGEECKQLKLIIRVDSSDNPQIVITYANNSSLNKSGFIYKKMRDSLQIVCSQLEYMLNKKTSENIVVQDSNPIASFNNYSVADEILKFKKLLDEGIITQEEFDKKKKDLLE